MRKIGWGELVGSRYITKQQVKLYMSIKENKQLSKAACAAKAGISTRSGYTITKGKHYTQQIKKHRQHKTRTSPIDQIWIDELEPMITKSPELEPMSLFIHMQRNHCNNKGEPLYDRSILRTLQRRVAKWKALNGPAKDVIIPQEHLPGKQALSDFTHMDKLNITINGDWFKHMLYHFRLVFSKWSHVMVVRGGGESFQALSEGMQKALIELGGVPSEHRTDSLSAAFKNIHTSAKADATKRYEELCKHYGMIPTRNNKGVSHENGSVESAHGHLKNRINQELILRGSRDFTSLHEYEQWIQAIVANSNKRNSVNFEIEKQALSALPIHPTMDYELLSVKVSSLSIIIVRGMTYSVASRLSGQSLSVHLYQDRIELYLGSVLVATKARQYKQTDGSRYVIDYRDIIHSLVKKPNAFRYCKYREELMPSEDYRLIWKHIDEAFSMEIAPKHFLRLLKLAADYDCEQALGEHVLEIIRKKATIDIASIEARFNTSNPKLPESAGQQHSLAEYDRFIPCSTSTQSAGGAHHATI